MIKELITMDMPIESVYHDYKLVADSIIDDKSFQNADTGILLSNLYDVVKALEKQIPIELEKQGYFKVCKCGCEMSTFLMHNRANYCPNCGQAIKWE